MVFLTPYVLDTPAELEAYSRRRKTAADAGEMWSQGFSGSRLADPPDREAAQRLHETGIDPAAPIGAKSIRILSQPQPILDDRTTLTTNAPQADPVSETPERTPAP